MAKGKPKESTISKKLKRLYYNPRSPASFGSEANQQKKLGNKGEDMA